MSQLRVGMIVRRVRDPDKWLTKGIRGGSMGVVVTMSPPVNNAKMVGINYFDAPLPSGGSRRTVATNLEVLDEDW